MGSKTILIRFGDYLGTKTPIYCLLNPDQTLNFKIYFNPNKERNNHLKYFIMGTNYIVGNCSF